MFELIGRAKAISESDIPNFETWLLRPGTNLNTIIVTIINWVLFLAGVLTVIYLVYGGILYITASGDAEKATKGRTAVINAIIGIVIILLALVIANWIRRILNP